MEAFVGLVLDSSILKRQRPRTGAASLLRMDVIIIERVMPQE